MLGFTYLSCWSTVARFEVLITLFIKYLLAHSVSLSLSMITKGSSTGPFSPYSKLIFCLLAKSILVAFQYILAPI